MKESLPPTPDEVASAALKQIDELDLDDIKAKIPKIVYSGMLKAAFIMDQHLNSRDQKRRKEAAAVFLDRLGQANFLKNIAALSAGEEKKNQHKPAKAEWVGEEKK